MDFSLLIGLGLIALYFVPTIVAVNRDHQVGPVAVINIFLGWSLIGWVVALAIAVSGDSAKLDAPKAS